MGMKPGAWTKNVEALTPRLVALGFPKQDAEAQAQAVLMTLKSNIKLLPPLGK